jgi:hypothetical protein
VVGVWLPKSQSDGSQVYETVNITLHVQQQQQYLPAALSAVSCNG